jgi:flagellar hook protein FlgE
MTGESFMPSTTALYSALSGLNANARNIDVIGNNIANVNTTAFKSSRLMFSSLYSKTMSNGTPPQDASGGTNPMQVGFGVNIAGTQRNFARGGLNATGDARDLAIEGDGFFMVERGTETRYTRAGAFRQNAQQELTTIGGDRLLGYGVDTDFNVRGGTLQAIKIPLGGMPIAEATENVTIAGNLKADGALATHGSLLRIGGTTTTGLRAVSTANPPPGTGNVINTDTLLTQIEDPSLAGSDTPLFSAGQSIQIRNAEKGNKTLETRTFEITTTTTVQDLNEFIADALSISSAAGANPDGATPGVSIDPVTGMISVVSNTGTANDVSFDTNDFRLLDASGELVKTPFVASKIADADGESIRTTFVAYDSLGAPVEVDATFVLDSRSTNATTWRYYIESSDDTDLNAQLATGTLRFDTDGRLIDTTPITFTIDRNDQGVSDPMAISLRLEDQSNILTSLADDVSQVAATFRDGAPLGTLAAFSVGVDGTITGSFTNGQTRTIGQIPVATFTNNEGLVDEGDNLFRPGANSGVPVISTAGTLGAGGVVGGALELSNVEMGDEFIKLIQSSTGYSANSRVIRTTDELMQQLLVLGR